MRVFLFVLKKYIQAQILNLNLNLEIYTVNTIIGGILLHGELNNILTSPHVNGTTLE